LLPLPLSLSISPLQLSPLPPAVVDCCLLLSAYAVATVAATAATASAAAITTASSVSRRLRRHAALTFRPGGDSRGRGQRTLSPSMSPQLHLTLPPPMAAAAFVAATTVASAAAHCCLCRCPFPFCRRHHRSLLCQPPPPPPRRPHIQTQWRATQREEGVGWWQTSGNINKERRAGGDKERRARRALCSGRQVESATKRGG
jgi:hypothetical protein